MDPGYTEIIKKEAERFMDSYNLVMNNSHIDSFRISDGCVEFLSGNSVTVTRAFGELSDS